MELTKKNICGNPPETSAASSQKRRSARFVTYVDSGGWNVDKFTPMNLDALLEIGALELPVHGISK